MLDRPRNLSAEWGRLLVVGACALLFAALVVLGSPRPEISSVYILAVALIMLVLAISAKLFMLATRRLRGRVGPRLRMALASLDQPGNRLLT